MNARNAAQEEPPVVRGTRSAPLLQDDRALRPRPGSLPCRPVRPPGPFTGATDRPDRQRPFCQRSSGSSRVTPKRCAPSRRNGHARSSRAGIRTHLPTKEVVMSTTVHSATDVRPFNVDVPEEKLDELRRRINATQWPPDELVDDQSQGVQSATMQALMRYWVTQYDWRRCEAELNALPQFKTEIDGIDIHFIHVKSPHESALPLILTHGWPGSVIEMLGVVGPLTDPTAYGGRAEDAFDLVVPSLPGFGFSGQPTELGWDQNRTAKAWAELMSRLGYTRYVAQGGDQGASVTDAMARLAPDGLAGIHLNFLSAFPTDVLAAVFGAGAVHGLGKRLAVSVLAAHAERKEPAALA